MNNITHLFARLLHSSSFPFSSLTIIDVRLVVLLNTVVIISWPNLKDVIVNYIIIVLTGEIHNGEAGTRHQGQTQESRWLLFSG